MSANGFSITEAENAVRNHIGLTVENPTVRLVLLLILPAILRVVFDPATGKLALARLGELIGVAMGRSPQDVFEFDMAVLPSMSDLERDQFQRLKQERAFEAVANAFDSEKALKQAALSIVLGGLAILL